MSGQVLCPFSGQCTVFLSTYRIIQSSFKCFSLKKRLFFLPIYAPPFTDSNPSTAFDKDLVALLQNLHFQNRPQYLSYSNYCTFPQGLLRIFLPRLLLNPPHLTHLTLLNLSLIPSQLAYLSQLQPQLFQTHLNHQILPCLPLVPPHNLLLSFNSVSCWFLLISLIISSPDSPSFAHNSLIIFVSGHCSFSLSHPSRTHLQDLT